MTYLLYEAWIITIRPDDREDLLDELSLVFDVDCVSTCRPAHNEAIFAMLYDKNQDEYELMSKLIECLNLSFILNKVSK